MRGETCGRQLLWTRGPRGQTAASFRQVTGLESKPPEASGKVRGRDAKRRRLPAGYRTRAQSAAALRLISTE